ncbi:MAG: glutamyl-tRNA(Gln) amidotransferase subunit [Thermoproteota archaeon]|nr:glutamyl-tRNA(Gln) amidotransferase subunit [Thermoproteota archaeon]
MSLDYSKTGLKIGIEIHQQLETLGKLFCLCKSELSTGEPEITFYRRLRPTQSELGEVDPAAYFEFKRGRGFLYEADRQTTCLVEMDEEPPHNLNREAVDVCLTVALMVGAKPVDEIHVMRKIVIDGSNTTGFQRTCIIALGGEVIVGEKKVTLQTMCLEEDAARKTGEEGLITRYRLDRLCVPLIEIATAPVIYSPADAEKVALALGQILRATRKVKRGLGTIRQDLNVSITDGALTEIKGVQELDLVATFVEYEVRRQLELIKIRDELAKRGVRKEEIKENFVDVTDVFNQTNCQVIQKAVERNGRVMAVALPKFAKLVGMELIPGLRFGTELSDYAKFWGRVGGIFHSDELPAYGITEDEVKKLKEILKLGEADALVLVADKKENALDALAAVVGRARQALVGVPSETRGASPDGITRYSRPRPGAARMYPETDVPPVPITIEHLTKIRQRLPELPEVIIKRFMQEYELNQKLASQLMSSDYLEVFESTVRSTRVAPSFVAATLTETLKGLKREGVEVELISDNLIERLFKMVDSNTVAKEAAPDILSWMVKHKEARLEEAVEALGFRMISKDKMEELISRIVEDNEGLIRERKSSALGPLMGIVMKDVRGKFDAKIVSQLLGKKIEEKLKETS